MEPQRPIDPAAPANDSPAAPEVNQPTVAPAGGNLASPGAPVNTNGNVLLNTADLTAGGEDRHKVYVTYQGTYDDNLFRIPDGAYGESLLAPGNRRADYINSEQLGFDGQGTLGQQIFDLNAHVEENRFVNNDVLNNTAYYAAGLWNWLVTSRLSGQVGADFSHAQAAFAALRYLGRDLVNITEYFANGRFQIGPRWALIGEIRDFRTLHGADETKVNDYHSKTGNVGVEFALFSANTVTLNYHYTDADYAYETTFNGQPFDSDYDEDRITAVVHYVLSAKTLVDVTGGYVKRDIIHEPIGNFSGDIWRVAAAWLPTEKLRVDASYSRDLEAYLDAQSDYFVAKTVTLAPSYLLSDKVKMSFTASHASQNYASLSDVVIATGPRNDTITSARFGVDYVPITALTLGFLAGYERRNSNIEFFTYKDALARITATFKF